MAGTNVNYQLITYASKINPLHMALNHAVYAAAWDALNNSVWNSVYASVDDSVWRLVNKTIQEHEWK